MSLALRRCAMIVANLFLFANVGTAAVIDGANIPGEGLTLRAVQNSPTAFGNAIGGGQDSAGGSELNALYADVDNGVLTLGITGNLEANFNKMFIFFDAVPGGESTLAGDNADGGFGEINNLAGLSFGGPTMDHGLRLEVGTGFWGVNGFDLIDNTGFSVWSGGGPGDLPAAGLGSGGVTLGWDNSNVLGVDGASAAGALTATTGFEFEIDMNTFFGSSDQLVYVSAIITNGDGSFASNQVLPGISSLDNLGGVGSATIGAVAIPEPSTLLVSLLGLAGLAWARKQ